MASSDVYHYDRETILQEHESFLNLTRGSMVTSPSVPSIELQIRTFFELNAFEAMKICDLTPGGNCQNKIIYSTQISEIATAESLYYFIIEDEFGNACRVSVSTNVNSVPLVLGVRLGFLNPMFNIAIDRRSSLTVRNPLDICLLKFEPISIPKSIHHFPQTFLNPNKVPPSSKSDAAESEISIPNLAEDTSDKIQPYDDGTNLSQIGNKLFKEGRYLQAIIQYTRAIEANANDAVFYSNRALCYTKINELDNALTDFEQANNLDPECFKYQYLVSLTWARLGNHRLCVELLKKIKPKDNSDSQIVERKLKEEMLFVKNIEGCFDFAKMQNNFINHIPNNIGDFVGAIQILSSPKHGRGVFTTRDVRKGENLCVVKASAFLDKNVGNCGCDSCRKGMVTFITVEKSLHKEIVESSARSKLIIVRTTALIDIKSNPEVNINLYTGCGYEFVKNFDTAQYPMDELFSMVSKKLIIDFYPFYPQTPFPSLQMGTDPLAIFFNGIWLLPSFLNHSCIPNAVKIYIGDICIVRAIADIPLGEEVLISYLPLPLFPNVQERSGILGFQCDCKLCELEKIDHVKQVNLEIMRLLVYLGSFTRIPPCIAFPMKKANKVAKISREDWCNVKSKLMKLAEQLKVHCIEREKFFPTCLQTTFLDLLMLRTCESDALELFQESEAYYSLLNPDTYVRFWYLWSGCISANSTLVPPTRLQYVEKNWQETNRLFT